jgi:hypothetical protein
VVDTGDGELQLRECQHIHNGSLMIGMGWGYCCA